MTAVAFDTETWLIRPAQLAPPMVCLTSAIAVTGARLFHANDACMEQGPLWANGQKLYGGSAKEHFEWILEQDPIYGANVAYDMCVALAKWPDLFGKVFKAYDEDRVIDIQLSQRLIDNANGLIKMWNARKGYSLAGLVKRYLKEDRSATKSGPDIWRLRYAELRDVPVHEWPQAAVDYALQDAQDTLDVARKQLEFIKYLKDSPAQARAAFALQLMMCWGVKTDKHKIEQLSKTANAMYEDLSKELIKAELVRENGTRNTLAAKQRMFNVMEGRIKLTKTGYEKYKDTIKKKGPLKIEEVFTPGQLLAYTSVDEDACNQSGDETLVKYSRRTQLHNIVHTHVPDLLDGVNTPIQPSYTTMVDSGRTACSKSRDENNKKKKGPTNGFQFQNPKKSLLYMPKGVGVRECFVAREGFYFADNDFTGLELHTGSQVCLATVGFSKLAEALNAGIDPHLSFAAQMMKISYEEALARKHEKVVKYHRTLAKIANFGFPGGLGVEGLIGFARGYGVKLTPVECKKLRDDWFKAFPEWQQFFKWIRGHVDLKTGLGQVEQLYVGRKRGGARFPALCNTMFQGLGADGAKHALYEVAKHCYVKHEGSTLYGVRPVGFIHDEILAEVLKELAHEQAFEMAKIMVDACNKFLPDVPVKCTPALCKHWTKDAEAVFNFDGRLQPFDLARDGQWEAYWDQEHREPVDWKEAA